MNALRRLGLSLIMAGLSWPLITLAQTDYPRLANYYLSYFNRAQYAQLARWDLLVLQPDLVYYQAPFFAYYRAQRPAGKLLAYTYPATFYRPSVWYDYWGWRQNIFRAINQHDWWLKDARGQVVASWPNMSVVNLTNPDWRDFNLHYLDKTFSLKEKWDGVFYDLVDAKASLYNQSGIDINADGRADAPAQVDAAWQAAMAQWLAASRQLWPDKLIMINGNSLSTYQGAINGRMFEEFPTPWEAGGTWADSMRQYLSRLPALNLKPDLYIINVAYNPQSARNFYQQMRFGLTSTLLGDGYFSFDNGAASHAQVWWFDEYNVNLGESLGRPVNLSAPGATDITAGLWRRDFSGGVVFVNASSVPGQLRLPAGRFKRLRGWQDPLINNGQAVDSLLLCPKDGIILLRQNTAQPELAGDYLSSIDRPAAEHNRSRWGLVQRRLKQGRDKLIIWFNYYYYGQQNRH